MNGRNMQLETTYIPLSPTTRRMHGRSSTKRKKGCDWERGKHRVSKVGKKVTCGMCKVVGNKRKTCSIIDIPSKLVAKRAKKTTLHR